MAYQVLFKKSALKEFKRAPKKVRTSIIEGLQLLSVNPYSDLLRVKKVKGGESLYRFRVGDWRVVYELTHSELLIHVIKVGHRSDVYRSV